MRQILTALIPAKIKVKLRSGQRVLESATGISHEAYRFLEYHAGVRLGWRNPLIPPDWLHSVGPTDYVQTGDEFFDYFVNFAELKPQDRILDVGCGTGRMARPLTKYLKDGGYDGIDIVVPSIEWCQKTYSRYPNFHFHSADIYNKIYNPDGKYQAYEYRFPFETSSFDFVFLTSVFTHILPKDMENYISEIARVLKQGGRCFATYFLLNSDSLKLIEQNASDFAFRYELRGCRVDNEHVQEAAVGYDETTIRELYQKHKLNVWEPIRYGSWCGRKTGLSYQDIVIASKPL